MQYGPYIGCHVVITYPSYNFGIHVHDYDL